MGVAVVVDAAYTIDGDSAVAAGGQGGARVVAHKVDTNGEEVGGQVIGVGALPALAFDRNIAATCIEGDTVEEHPFVFGLVGDAWHARSGRTHGVVGAVQAPTQGDIAAVTEHGQTI